MFCLNFYLRRYFCENENRRDSKTKEFFNVFFAQPFLLYKYTSSTSLPTQTNTSLSFFLSWASLLTIFFPFIFFFIVHWSNLSNNYYKKQALNPSRRSARKPAVESGHGKRALKEDIISGVMRVAANEG